MRMLILKFDYRLRNCACALLAAAGCAQWYGPVGTWAWSTALKVSEHGNCDKGVQLINMLKQANFRRLWDT